MQKHPQKKRLFKKALRHFKLKEWRLTLETYDKIFGINTKFMTEDPHANNYWIAINHYVDELCRPYFKINRKGRFVPKWHIMNVQTNDRQCAFIDLSVYKLIRHYYQKRIQFVKRLKQLNPRVYGDFAHIALSEYVLFLRTFDKFWNHPKMFKYLCKMQIYSKGLKHDYLTSLYLLVKNGKFDLALQFMKFHNDRFELDTNEDIVNMLEIFLYCYMLQRLGGFTRCLDVWSKIETQFDYDTIDRMLFPGSNKEDAFPVETLHKHSRCKSFPTGLRAVGLFLPNTTIFDMKLECFIALKQYGNAKELCNYYYDRWGEDDQTVFYDGYLDLRMGNIVAAQSKLKFNEFISPNWKQNQHYFAGLLYYELKEYDHAKYHFVSAIFGCWALTMYEHYHWLCLTLIKCKEWILSMHFLRKARKLISSLQGRYVDEHNSTSGIVANAVKKLRCANTDCMKKESDFCNLRVCKGCGKSVYCGRKCQKKHWKQSHRSECDGAWLDLFQMIKTKKYIKCPYDNHFL